MNKVDDAGLEAALLPCPFCGWSDMDNGGLCHWAFEMVGARPEDDLDDMFPGTGAVAEAWRTWRGKFTLPVATPPLPA